MTQQCLIQNSKVVQIEATTFPVHSDLSWIEDATDTVKVGWTHDGTSFVAPPAPAAVTWTDIRTKRHTKIHDVAEILDRHRNQKDYGISTVITDAQAQLCADYLQDLRDITDLSIHTSWNGPEDVVWPEVPI